MLHQSVGIPVLQFVAAYNTLVINLLVQLYTAINQQVYRVFVADQRLWIPDRQIATYPDIMVVPEPIALMTGRKDTIVNPILKFCQILQKPMIVALNLLLIATFPLFKNIY
jgi:hypothetical protein